MQKLKITLAITAVIAIITVISVKVSGNAGDNFCLMKSYDYYKANFMSEDGRIIDYEKNDVTTSEGQSYMMLRSLIMEDKKTFDKVFMWSKYNLQQNGKLFGWLWGKNEMGEYKLLDNNSASDADVDIATALLLAYEKWGSYYYLEEALNIIRAIWDEETKQIDGHLVLMPGYKQAMDEKNELNPSYFSPYSFRLFQKYDELHDWNMLIDSSYYFLNKATSATKTGLPPNWFVIKDGNVLLDNSERSDFSYDAVRVFARIYIDYKESGEKRAKPILEKSKFFVSKWKTERKMYTNYKYNGELRDKNEYPGSIAILIPAINLYNKKIAEEIYTQKLEPYVENPINWRNKKDYYSKNLVWFGLYLYQDKIKGCDIKSEVIDGK